MTCSRVNNVSMWDCFVLEEIGLTLVSWMELTWMENSDSLRSICGYYELLTIVTYNIYDSRIEDTRLWDAELLNFATRVSIGRSCVNKCKN
jgi:hypothetical protein